jgi:hypothetical protein
MARPRLLGIPFIVLVLFNFTSPPALRAGTIEGKVMVTAPARKEIQSHDDGMDQPSDGYAQSKPNAMPATTPLPEEIVVYLKKVPGHFPPPKKHAQLDQKFDQFTHRVLPILAGTTVDFTNHDPIYHNIFSNSFENEKFDLGRRKSGETASITFDKPEVPVKLYCEIHPKMQSNILVLQNPFFAVVQPNGTFKLENVPAGTYSLRAWHDYWSPVSKTVKVKKKGTTQADLTLSSVKD